MRSRRALVLAAMLLGVSIPAFMQEAGPEHLLLKDYHPRPIYKVPVTQVAKAKFGVIDMHSHAYAKTSEQIREWVATMAAVGVDRTVILTGVTGSEFEELRSRYGAYPERFELWCGLDFSEYPKPGFERTAIRAMQRCQTEGAKGIGELSDKGEGFRFGNSFAHGLHANDPRMDAIWEKAAELGMPVSIHVAEPQWMYEPMDAQNDGLMNAYTWRRDNKGPLPNHTELMRMLEEAARKHPRTTFIACHFANLESNLDELGRLLDRYPNLYADIAARYGETAPIPRYMAVFYKRYATRLVYGTDMGFDKQMYRDTFRILETLDEHFYVAEYGYHWALSGFGLPDEVLKRVYRENALDLVREATQHAKTEDRKPGRSTSAGS